MEAVHSEQGFPAFPADGEMGERTRALDWSQASLGSIAGWPQSLKTTVRIMLSSRYPMFIWWGRELTNFYNDAYTPFLGKRHPAALGQSAAQVWSEIWSVVGPQAETVLNEGGATWNEERLLIMERYGFSEETYFTFSYSPIPDDSGAIGGVLGICNDDTARVLSQRRLRTLRALAARTIDEAKSRSARNTCQAAAQVLAENPHDLPFALLYLLDKKARHAKLAGLTRLSRDLPASPATIDLDDERDGPWPFRQVIETGQGVEVNELVEKFGPLPGGAWSESPQQALILPIAKAGQDRLAGFLIAGVSPLRPLDDEYRGFMGVLASYIATAVATARAHEEERRRAKALAELNRVKTAFFSNISHELRTPLALMFGPLEDLLSGNDAALSTTAREQLKLMNRSGLRLPRLVNTLLDFFRIEAGRVQIMHLPTNLAAFTADLASVFRAAVEQAGLRLTVDNPNLSKAVYVDQGMREKIVLNLLSNAFKFTFKGEISVSLRQAGQAVELRVRDTGTGISANKMPNLFKRFHRIESSRRRIHEGSGIGLALVQALIKLHGGTIITESVVDKDTTFIVTMPLDSHHLSPERIGGEPSRATARGSDSCIEEALQWQSGNGGLT